MRPWYLTIALASACSSWFEPAPEIVPPPSWELEQTDGQVTASIRARGTDTHRPVLVARCADGELEVYLRTPDPLDGRGGSTSLRWQVDDIERELHGRLGTGGRTAFLPDPARRVDEMLEARHVEIGFSRPVRGMGEAQLAPQGGREALVAVGKACR